MMGTSLTINSHLMAMPRVSDISPLALRKDDDSVDNEKKDFAPPIKKMKVDRDLVGEEKDNTDSVPKVAASLTEREREEELLKLFKDLFQKTYPDEAEENYRFGVFKENLERPTPTTTHSKFGLNCPGLADLTPEELELDDIQPGTQYYFYCSTSVSYFQELFAEELFAEFGTSLAA